MGGERLHYRRNEKEAQPEPPTTTVPEVVWQGGPAACHDIGVRKFLAVVVGVVALGLTLRFTLNKKPTPKKPAVQQPVSNQPTPPEPTPEVKPPPSEIAPTPVEPEPQPPRIAGSLQISDTSVRYFATGPGVLYYCEGSDMMREHKDGTGAPERIGDCDQSHDLVADANGLYYCADDRIMRVTAGTNESHVVAEMECIMSALDARYAYFVRPGFEGIPDPGVYRVDRAGGTPERFHQRAKEQFGVVTDDDSVWVTGYFLGQVTRFPKGGGAGKLVLTGQKNLEDFGVTTTHMYWFVEDAAELRRRKKTGGPIEVVAKQVMYPIAVVDNHVYWFERTDGTNAKLLHLAPNVQDKEELASGLRMPSMKADSEGVYINELDRPGIFWFKRRE